ncbi:RING finger protein 141 [Syngnathus acus]|uniref:RING finger protein 141 n=1 Tax=Syngnathus acus TaxID=161584 RepID=UPI0018860F42|nr:RING finger protein 141 [Syngnathus acus]
MGQQISGQAARIPEKLLKHVGLMRDSGYLTYEEFLARVAELNDLTAKLAAGQHKHLLFEVQPGSDASALWKVAVRILCTKINKTNGTVEASRIMNLYQFIQLYCDMTSQAASVLAAEGAAAATTTTNPEASCMPPLAPDACQASMWMGRVKELTDDEECCICMDCKADLILPCTHRFCQKCIDKWSRNCPMCRLQVTAANDSWVMSDFPTENDMAGYILNLADEAGHPHQP